MNILVAGASGYIGSAIVEALLGHGHSAVGIARSPAAHAALTALGAKAVPGDLRDPASLVAALQTVDGIIYSVQVNDEQAFEIERSALTSIANALSGTGKAFVYTSGCWYYGDTGDSFAREDDPPNPPALVANRPALEKIVLDTAARDVRSMVIRPGVVYGKHAGIAMMFVQSARETGAARFVGDGSTVWPLVHVDDLAELYVLAVEKGKAGDVFNAADESELRVHDIARAASESVGAGGKTSSWPVEDSRQTLGPFADALVLSQKLSTERARTRLGWTTRKTSVLDEF